MNTIHVRIEEKTKVAASKALGRIGLDLSTGVKIFLQQVITEQGLPFTPTVNRELVRAKWDGEVARALKGRGFLNAHDALKDL